MDHEVKLQESVEFGCAHYKRRCLINAPCCNEIFGCRHCHNEAKNFLDIIDPLLRHEVKKVICSLCSTEQDEVNHEELETSHIVLIHGGGFGAWCWYKTIALLQECKFKVTAIDSTASGIDRFDANSVKSLSQYVKPLTDFLEKLADGEKVILAGHDFGGVCISYAMELFPTKVSKAIFIAALMLKSGQSTLDMFSHKENTSDLMRQAQTFLYANGNTKPPTAIDLEKSLLKDLLFNQSPNKLPEKASLLFQMSHQQALPHVAAQAAFSQSYFNHAQPENRDSGTVVSEQLPQMVNVADAKEYVESERGDLLPKDGGLSKVNRDM